MSFSKSDSENLKHSGPCLSSSNPQNSAEDTYEHLGIKELRALEQLRGNPIIMYIGQDAVPFPKPIEDEDVQALYECLSQMGKTKKLDILLHTYGGEVTNCRRLVHLLYSYASDVSVLIPYKVRSAGTLLCLGAREIIMGPLAELGPIDPQLPGAINNTTGNLPQRLSSEDIRAFKQMAETWFHIQSEEQYMHLLKLLCERIFPISLASFFRAEQLVRSIAHELLPKQLPDITLDARQKIVDQFISGYYSHDYGITFSDAAQIGLNVKLASAQEEILLWTIWQKCRWYLNPPSGISGPEIRQSVDGILASTNFIALHLVQWLPYTGNTGTNTGQPIIVPQVRSGYWERLPFTG